MFSEPVVQFLFEHTGIGPNYTSRRAAGSSAPQWRNPADSVPGRYALTKNRRIIDRWTSRQVGAVLALRCSEHHMFRAAVLSIALALAAGPNTSLLCEIWCDSHPAPAIACQHHGDTSTSLAAVAADDTCHSSALDAPAFVREVVRPGVSAPDAAHAVIIPLYQLDPSITDASHDEEPWRGRSLDNHPLSTTLRI